MGEFRFPRFVQQPVTRPHHCAFIPFLGGSNSKGFFDSGTDYWGERIYCSVEAVEQMAGDLGWVAPAAVRVLDDALSVAEDRARDLEREVAELRAFKEQFVALQDAGVQIKRRPGRPRKEATVG